VFAAIFFLLQSHYIGILRSQSSCTVGGSTRDGLTRVVAGYGEMAALRMTRTPKNIGRTVQFVFIFVLIINWF